jgi:hypothetical protein
LVQAVDMELVRAEFYRSYRLGGLLGEDQVPASKAA